MATNPIFSTFFIFLHFFAFTFNNYSLLNYYYSYQKKKTVAFIKILRIAAMKLRIAAWNNNCDSQPTMTNCKLISHHMFIKICVICDLWGIRAWHSVIELRSEIHIFTIYLHTNVVCMINRLNQREILFTK